MLGAKCAALPGAVVHVLGAGEWDNAVPVGAQLYVGTDLGFLEH